MVVHKNVFVCYYVTGTLANVNLFVVGCTVYMTAAIFVVYCYLRVCCENVLFLATSVCLYVCLCDSPHKISRTTDQKLT